jgi:hypothetical protein
LGTEILFEWLLRWIAFLCVLWYGAGISDWEGLLRKWYCCHHKLVDPFEILISRKSEHMFSFTWNYITNYINPFARLWPRKWFASSWMWVGVVVGVAPQLYAGLDKIWTLHRSWLRKEALHLSCVKLINTSLLTSGSETLSYADNCFIFYSVFRFIKGLKDF